jgi:hypothetical protein
MNVDRQQTSTVSKWLLVGLAFIYLVLFSLKYLSFLPPTATWPELVIIPLTLVVVFAVVSMIALWSKNALWQWFWAIAYAAMLVWASGFLG